MAANGLSDDLEWWRANRAAPQPDPARLRQVLDRLRAWKAQHDADRAGQPAGFLQMAWDGVFGDDESRVVEAIGEIEAALGA